MNNQIKLIKSSGDQSFDIEWICPAYFHYKKGWKWFSIAGSVILGAVIYSLVTGEWLSAIVFILLSGVYAMHYLQPIPLLHTGISKLGIQIGNKFYGFNQLKTFWINYNPPFSTLHVILANKMQKEIEINLVHQDPVAVRNMLINEIPELEGRSESFMSILARLLRL